MRQAFASRRTIPTRTTFSAQPTFSKGISKPHSSTGIASASPQIEQTCAKTRRRASRPSLLDHAFAFSPAATLTLPQFLDTNARIRGLGIFPQFHFDLNARNDGKFDAVFRARELNGFGDSKLEALFLFFQGLPFQEVNPQFYNLHGEAINFDSMFRWDAQKRRIFARFLRPL